MMVDGGFSSCDNLHVNAPFFAMKPHHLRAWIGSPVVSVLVAVGSLGCGNTKGEPDVKAMQGREVVQVPFNTAGWRPSGPQRWQKDNGGELELQIEPPPSIDMQNESRFRDMMRQEVLRRGGGLVSADVDLRGSSRIGRVVAKFPQEPSGMTYEGWLLFERLGTSHRAILRFPELGVTGVRDTIVMAKRMNGQPDDVDPMSGWMLDPYDKSRRDPLMRNVADDNSYDAGFPKHPLTLVRSELAAIEGSLQL